MKSRTATIERSPARPEPFEQWQWDEDLERIQTLLRLQGEGFQREPAVRIDAAHDAPAGPHHDLPQAAAAKPALTEPAATEPAAPEPLVPAQPLPSADRMTKLATIVLTLGLVITILGSVYLMRAYNSGRGQLWATAIPLCLWGHLTLLLGLFVQLENLRRRA